MKNLAVRLQILATFAVLMLSGCGQTGPLSLPEQQSSQSLTVEQDDSSDSDANNSPTQ